MAIKGYSTTPKLQHYWSLTVRFFNVICRAVVGGALPLCRDSVDVFYSSSRLGQNVNVVAGLEFELAYNDSQNIPSTTMLRVLPFYLSLYLSFYLSLFICLTAKAAKFYNADPIDLKLKKFLEKKKHSTAFGEINLQYNLFWEVVELLK